MVPEMHIDDIFRMSDGQTVFTGLIIGYPERIKACRCELKQCEETRQFINIVGESIPKKLIQSERRSISTFEKVNLSQEEAQSGKWRIVMSSCVLSL
jgi:hypothetical protein